MTDDLADHEGEPAPDAAAIRPLSGDPLLKRLVDLANLGFQAQLTLFSNGTVLKGTLIPARAYRAALGESIRAADPGPFATLDSIVASAVASEEPGPSGMGAPADVPEPRYIHLADVTIGPENAPLAPFLRLRLPAVSGFWVERSSEAADEIG